ncbi:MAG TPA: hypothetical protein PK705_07730 [Clostridia bacterium]|jgi:hypothetical protein|nr:hypothetical protein [Clostridia bacterium]
MKNGENADGMYFEEKKRPAEGGSVLHSDIRDVKDSLANFARMLDTFETVSVEVEIDTEHNKIRASVRRPLQPGESMEDAHQTLYRQCLQSIAKLV